MVSITPDEFLTTVCTLCSLATVATIIRLARSYFDAKLYFDDLFTGVATTAFIVLMASGFIHARPYNYSADALVASNYLSDYAFYTTIWFARLALWASLLRIMRGVSARQRMVMWIVGGALVLQYFFLMIQVLWVCIPTEHEWRKTGQCALGKEVAVTQMVSNVISDVMLLAVPIHLFSSLHVDLKKRMRLIFVFSGSVFITIVSITHSVAMLRVAGIEEALLAVVECFVAVIACNMPGMYMVAVRVARKVKSTSFISSRFTSSRHDEGEKSGTAHVASRNSNGSLSVERPPLRPLSPPWQPKTRDDPRPMDGSVSGHNIPFMRVSADGSSCLNDAPGGQIQPDSAELGGHVAELEHKVCRIEKRLAILEYHAGPRLPKLPSSPSASSSRAAGPTAVGHPYNSPYKLSEGIKMEQQVVVVVDK